MWVSELELLSSYLMIISESFRKLVESASKLLILKICQGLC